MSDIIYEFTANHASELWSTDPAKMVDGTETSYASTTTDGDIQCLITNECVGTDLGTISKVELRFYGYGDADDQCWLRPVFDGTDDGDNHSVVPGVGAGWKAWQDITHDTNAPAQIKESVTSGDTGAWTAYDSTWVAQTFTTTSAYTVGMVELLLYRTGSPGTLTVSIKATDGSGHPTGADLASGTYDGDTLPTSSGAAEWRGIGLSEYSLSDGTKYAIVIRAIGGNISNKVNWRCGAALYADGAVEWSDDSGSSWETKLDDCLFKVGTGWPWSDVQNLDCDVEFNKVSKGNTMHVGMVQIQVTYEAEAPPPTGQPMIIRTRGIPTGPGSRIGGGAWN